MPATGTERPQARRAKLRDNPDQSDFEAYKKADRERKLKRVEMELNELEQIHKRGKIATRKWRVKKMDTGQGLQTSTTPSAHCTPYKSPASFGKAKRRVEKVLPNSPRKRVAIVKKLARDVLKIKLPTVATKSANNAELAQIVRSYYESDEISRVMPGKADVITVKHEDGTKSKMQKRHLYMTVGETFESFKADHPECTVGVSKFAALRPDHVLLTSKLPHNVCGCKYHNNIILLLEALHRKFPDIVPVYSSDFLDKCVCNYSNEDCMSDNCDKCKDGALLKQNLTAKITQLDACVKWH